MITIRRIFLGSVIIVMLLGAGAAFATQYAYTSFDYPGADKTRARGINNSGQIVGSYSAPYLHSFLKVDTAYTSFDYPRFGVLLTDACGINTTGQIVGGWAIEMLQSFLKVGDNYTSLDYPGGYDTQASGINDSGQIVGDYHDASGKIHGFLNVGDNYTSFDYPGGIYTQAYGINDSGQIVGDYGDASHKIHGFLKVGDNYTSFDYPGAIHTFPSGINDSGQIVGYYRDASANYHGFLKVGDNYTSINYPGGINTYAYGINDSGQIVGYYTTDATGGTYHGFIANPITPKAPPPTATVIFDNFDSGRGFHPTDNTVAACASCFSPPTPLPLRAAGQFTVTGGDYYLSSITLPISFANFNHTGQTLRVRLTGDSANGPGTTLEVLSENQGIWPNFANPFMTTTTLTSADHPRLAKGGKYWIVIELTSYFGTTETNESVDYRWFLNTSKTTVPFRQQPGPTYNVLPTDPWTGSSVNLNVAFRVEGTVVGALPFLPLLLD